MYLCGRAQNISLWESPECISVGDPSTYHLGGSVSLGGLGGGDIDSLSSGLQFRCNQLVSWKKH